MMLFRSFRVVSMLTKSQIVSPKSFDLTGSLSCSKRYIFSDTFLGLDYFNNNVQRLRLSTPDEMSYKDKLHESIVRAGAHNVFSEDLKTLINIATTEKDFENIRSILIDCIQNEMRSSRMYEPTKFFFMQCVSQLMVDQARLLWNDPVVTSSGMKGILNLGVLYLTLLYRVELFSELIEAYQSIPTKNLTMCTLAVAAAAKIGTKESFKQATDIFNDPKIFNNDLAKTSGGRVNALYAYHGYKIGLNGPTYDFLTDPRRVGRPSKFTTNLKISILVDVGRLKEALLVVRSELLPPRDIGRYGAKASFENDDQRKRTVFQEVMTKLTCAIREAQDPELSHELASLCKVLDQSAALSDQPLESSIFEPIEMSRKSRRKSPNDFVPLNNLYTRQ